MHKADRHAVLRDDQRADLAGFDNLQRFGNQSSLIVKFRNSLLSTLVWPRRCLLVDH